MFHLTKIKWTKRGMSVSSKIHRIEVSWMTTERPESDRKFSKEATESEPKKYPKYKK